VTQSESFVSDYAIEIFYSALSTGKFVCGLKPDTRLPMMHIDDCTNATVEVSWTIETFCQFDHDFCIMKTTVPT